MAADERGLRVLALGDIEDHAVDIERPSILVVDRLRALGRPTHGAVLVQDAILEAVGAAMRHGVVRDALAKRAIVRMDHAGATAYFAADKVAGRIAGQLLDAVADEQ